MYENMNNGAAAPMMGQGYMYGGMQPQQVPTIKNFLTDEEIAKLIKKENTFSLAVTETDKMRAACNHRFQNGNDAITETEDGLCRCSICGYTFNPLDTNTTKESLIEAVNQTEDILQTIKMIYVDMPAETAKEFFVIIPLLEKIPELFERAVASYARYDSVNAYRYNNKNMNVMNMFNVISGALNGGMGMGMPQEPHMAYQPGYSNGFVAQPNMGMGYQPGTTNFQYNPNQPMQPMYGYNTGMPVDPAVAANPANQQQPADTTATTDGKTVEVNTTFKA